MKLDEYFKKHNIKITRFAQYHNISRYSISKYLKGAVPSLEIATKIHKATNGAVSFEDLGCQISQKTSKKRR